MSRFAPQAPPPPPLGTGFVLDSTTGLYDLDGVVPQFLSGPLLATDLATIVRDIGSAGAPNPVPYAAAMSALLTGSTTQAPTPAPTPTSGTIPADGTLSGLPSTIVAGQQLSAVYITSQVPVTFALYHPDTGTPASARWPSALVESNLSVLIPQSAGSFTVRGYDASGNEVYESAQFTATAAPGPLPTLPTQTADTAATATGVTMTWTQTTGPTNTTVVPATGYLVLASPGAGPTVSAPNIYGIAGRSTVTSGSYTFAHLSANSSPLAAVIPQNGNGYGPAAAFRSSVSTTAVANETLTLASPGPQTSGSTFTLSGTYSGITPTAFDLQRVGAVGWTAVAASSVTIGNGTFTIAGVLATYTNPNTAYAVRDQNNPANTASTPAFAVS